MAESPKSDQSSRASEAADRKRRIAEIFGDALPETTRDERDPTPPTAEGGDERILREVPPHHA